MSIDDLWYKNAVIYCLDIETFMDSDGDGVGDFKGATRRLDYLWGLGITSGHRSRATGRMSPEPAYQREDGSAWSTRTTMVLLPARILPVRSTENAV